jgi:hypothetical protein
VKVSGRLRSCLRARRLIIRRLARSAAQTPLAEGLKVERNLFMDLTATDWAIDAMKVSVNNLED